MIETSRATSYIHLVMMPGLDPGTHAAEPSHPYPSPRAGESGVEEWAATSPPADDAEEVIADFGDIAHAGLAFRIIPRARHRRTGRYQPMKYRGDFEFSTRARGEASNPTKIADLLTHRWRLCNTAALRENQGKSGVLPVAIGTIGSALTRGAKGESGLAPELADELCHDALSPARTAKSDRGRRRHI